MTTTLYLDLETRSGADLIKSGSHVYWQDPEADVLIASWAFDDGPVFNWTRGEDMPADVAAHILAGGIVSGWNVFGFERLGFKYVLGPRYGWPVPELEQFSDSMHMAAAMALPKALGNAAKVLGLEQQKDTDGKRLIRKFSIKGKNGRWVEPEDDPEDFGRYVAYCDDDVRTERAVRKCLVPLSEAEQRLVFLDAKINDRGLRIDIKSARAAMRLAEKEAALINAQMSDVTGGAVRKVTEATKLLAWCKAEGVDLPAMDKAAIEGAMKTDLPPAVREALTLRQDGGKTSVKKLDAFLARAGRDGRARGNYIYHGAATGRWTSTGVNVANLPRPRGVFEDAHLNSATLFDAFRSEDPDVLRMLYGDDLGKPLHIASDAMRGFIWAAPGKRFVQADYSGIEGAVIAWLADERWKLKALFDIMEDPKTNPDMYRQTAARILNLTTDIVTKKHWARQAIGKTSELSLGFQGGCSAFATMAKNYGVDLDSLYPHVWENASPEERAKAMKRHAAVSKRGKEASTSMSANAWVACELIKKGWREQNSAIAASWREAERAVREAVETPGTVTEAVRCKFIVRAGYLWMMLPSGRCLAYASPRLSAQVWACIRLDDGQWSDPEVMDREEAEALAARGQGKIEGDTSPKVSFLSEDATTKQWRRQALYGGLIVQNATQATARDILVNGLWKAEEAGYPVVLHTYDEMLTEVPNGFGNVKEFERLICELPSWATGMPLSADGWEGKRYRK